VVAVAAIAEASSAASTATGVAAADAKPAPLIITKPAIGPMRALNLQMSKPVWLEVRDSGNNIIYYGIKPAGTKDTIKGAAPLMVVIGAADAMSLSVDGKPMDLTSIADGNVARLKIE
jgi:cytoskeleton protein RodZ